jgi:HSP20 family protein
MIIDTIELIDCLWYSHPMSKQKKHQPDEYFDQLATATEEVRDNGLANDYEGQLAVDVYQTKTAIIIRAAIAGVQAEDIDISVNNDMVTIKGLRHLDEDVPQNNYLYQECYWGGFSRTIILPVEVQSDQVTAAMKNGILRVTLPKNERPTADPIRVVDEDEE